MPKPAITTFSSLAVNQSPTNKDNGLYAPELTQEQIDAIPDDTQRNGGIVYNTDTNTFQVYKNGIWQNINTTTGDVTGPNGAVNSNVPVFDGITGKIIRDSGVPIAPVLALLLSQRTNKKFLKAPLVTVNEIGNLGHIRFVNDIGIIFVDGLMPVEFITNDFGPESQVCSLFTGGLPSVSSSPSALVELQTTTGTLLLSRLTQAEINALTLPIPGMVVYNTTTGKLSVYTANGWMPVFVADASGNLDMQGYKIINLATPTLSTDGANKGYVDAAISGIPSATITLTGGVTGSGVVTSPITTTVVSVAPSAITGYPGTTSTFLRGDGTWTNILSGNLGLQNTTPNAPLQFSNTLANRKIVLNEVLNNDHQITALGTNSNIFRFQVPATTTDYVFYAGTSSTTSNELARIKGTGGIDVVNNKIIKLATPTLATDAANKSYIDSTVSNVAAAKYIIQTSNALLPNAQVLASLATGIVKNTTTTGVLSIATAGTDYYAPGFPTFFKDTNGTTNNFFAGTNNNSIGTYNTGVGISTLVNTTGSFNTAIGYIALTSTTSGSRNVAVGLEAVRFNTTGNDNLGIGWRALTTNVNGSNNIAIGSGALYNNTSGISNLAIGYNALFFNTTASNNTAIGYEALYSCFGSTNNLGIGYQALHSNTSASSNLAIGNTALYSNTTGIVNLAVGHQALYSNITSNNNAAICYQALYFNSTGSFNLAFGNYALYNNTTAGFNLAVGYGALFNNTTGTNNLAIGYQASFQSGTTSYNIAIGDSALYSNTGGNNNVAVGYGALFNNITSSNNTALGYRALASNSVSGNNTGIGYQALFSNVAANNTAIGYNTLTLNTNGNDNTVIGYNAGSTYGTYVSCVLIGSGANTTATSLFNAIAIGTGATVGASNSLVLGNDCNIGIGTSTPTATGTSNLVVTNTIYGRRASGLIYSGGSGNFTPSGTGFIKIPGTTFLSLLNQFSMPANNRIQYTGIVTGGITVNITLNANVRTTTNTTTTLGVLITKNGLSISYSAMYTTSTTANSTHNITTTAFTTMNTNDFIEAFVYSSNTSLMDIPNMVLSVVAV